MTDISGKRIIVTGGARGIGEAAVRAFARSGAAVVSIDLNQEPGEAVAAEATEAGPGTVRFLHGDVSDRAGIDAIIDAAVDHLGGLDVLVNVAGIQKHAAVHEIPDDLMDRIFRINVYGTVYTNSAAFRHMAAGGGGAIINFGSESGLTAEPNNATYGMTKAAVHNWTRSVARDWGPSGIRVNAVLPYVVTPMYTEFRAALTPAELAAHDASTAAQIPLGGRFGDPDRDLAPVLVFLASDDSRFITGQLLPVDGGLISVR
ncbi:SDR family oxidoreductase [Cryobacterium frigoriphilum]|uniref:SDR family oxidoreductase n=1 Tax=Cryobacterium frigoriphilum TaxID=1259150 RepID=A0A4R8ZUJ0_9MICO|nr:SDR family oxidoreductase [Cryobacterium frigoriphilum]TFD45979.1 SDR family oxidoreductase [Cryobacterium frigoriphilum]